MRNDTVIVNPNMTYDQWNNGPQKTGSAVIDKDGKLYMGPTSWKGTVSHAGVMNGDRKSVV